MAANQAGIWRQAALTALGLQVAALFLSAGYALLPLTQGQTLTIGGWVDAGHNFLTGVLTAWWAMLFARLSLGRGIAAGEYLDKVARALAFSFPLLIALRGTLWAATALAFSTGISPANPVAVTALFAIWGGTIAASYMVFFWLLRWAQAGPGGILPRQRLEDWLNVSAALTLGMTAVNVVPIAGFSAALSRAEQLLYGGAGLLDMAATLLSMVTLQHLNRDGAGSEESLPF